MSIPAKELIQAVDTLKAMSQNEKPQSLGADFFSNLTRALCIANCCHDSVIKDAIERYLDAWHDLEALRYAPRLLFDHRATRDTMRDIHSRKKRERKREEERLVLLGIKKTRAIEFERYDPDLFRVEATEAVSHPKYHHTACQALSPAFEWEDQDGERQVRYGSVVAFVFEPEAAEQILEEVSCA